MKRTYTKKQLEQAVKTSTNYKQAIEKLGLNSNGSGGYRSIQKAIIENNIDISHFNPYINNSNYHKKIPIEKILIQGVNYNSPRLKERLYKEGLKERKCELCGQQEEWNGKKMSLILDHINGIHNDNRITNLQIVCPNCNATLDTHCGKKNRKPRFCKQCNKEIKNNDNTNYCNVECRRKSVHNRNTKHLARLANISKKKYPHHKSIRPPYETLKQEVQDNGYSAIGRKYGVSDNAIRKWVKQYQKELGIQEEIKFQKQDYYIKNAPIKQEELQSYIEQGLSLKEIGKRSKLSPQTIKRWCKTFGLETEGMKKVNIS